MKFKKKNSKLKFIMSLAMVTMLSIPGFLSLKSIDARADQLDRDAATEVEATHAITRNDGGGAYGTHTKPNYTENGVQYFRDGDIIEVDISLPEGHGSIIYQDVIKYDRSKLTLLSSYNDIRSTLSKNYLDCSWSNTVSAFNGDPSQIIVFGGTSDFDGNGMEWKGGSVARMYFRVNDGVESETGTPITFEFPRFQSAGYLNGGFNNRQNSLTHKGYDPARDSETAYYVAAPITITAKKPAAVVTPPELTLTSSSASIYEGDLFDPTSYIASASDAADGTVSKESVVISEGTGVNTKHQPTAGTYTYKYKVVSGTGSTTEKTLTLTVTARTYTVDLIDTAAKKISLPTGTSSKKLEETIDSLKGEDFDVKIACNDGTSFIAPGKVLSGKTEKYRVDASDNLLEQTFNLNVTLALPQVSYASDGTRVVTAYNGSPSFVSNVGTGQIDAIVPINISSGNSGNNNGGGSSKPSTPPTAGTSSTSGSTATGDTTNVALLTFLAVLSMSVMIRTKLKEQ